MPVYLLPLFFALVGCSLQKMALRSATPVFEKSSEGMMKEGNWEFFKASAPGNIKFLELIWVQDQENSELLSVLIKSYSGYAYTVHETLFLEDQLKGEEESLSKKSAISFYTRALDYGLKYLEEKGITKKELLSSDEKKLRDKLKKLDEKDFMAILYTAQSWGSLINLQKDNVALVSQLGQVKTLFDFVCSKKPDIDQNVCDIFYGQFYAGRPKMLGGDPEKGEEIFLKAIESHPKNLLIRISYIQHVIVPAMDQEKYEKVSAHVREELEKWENMNRDSLENESPYSQVPGLNLYNAIAKKRFEIIEKNKKSIF